MNKDTVQARNILQSGNHTCVFCKGSHILTDDRRGVKPLLELMERKLDGYCAADKVVGKAAAMLYRLMGITELYAHVISEPAIAVLESGGIRVFYNEKVPAIRNRTNTGFCPMEMAVWDLDDPQAAPEILRKTLSALAKN